MPNTMQRAFSSGELSPKLYARTDFAKYMSGLRTCRNFIVERTGGATNRQGTVICANTPLSGPTRVVRFQFSAKDACVMEFSQYLIRFYQNGALIGPSVVSPYAAADLFLLHFAQSGDVVTIAHPNYPPQELKRLTRDYLNWSLTPWVEGPTIPAPTAVTVAGTAGTPSYVYYITAIDATTGEESLAGVSASHLLADPTVAAPHTIGWGASANAASYRIYRQSTFVEALPGFIGTVAAPTVAFTNGGLAPDFTQQPPAARPLFNSANNYPSEVSYYQQRLLFAATNNNPGLIYGSKTGNFHNFLVSTPLEDDDAVTFQIAGRENSTVHYLMEIGKLIICTDVGEWLVEGDNAGVLTPTGVNTRIGSYDGCNGMIPIRVKNSLLYVQAVGTRVLELKANIMYGYYTFEGIDHTLLSAHLFDPYTLVDWDYQQVPNYNVWAVRSDGTLLGFTYVAAENMAAWHHHDTVGGLFESVCVIPEGNEYRVYVVVNRGGVRFVERFCSQTIVDQIGDPGFMDCASIFDGRSAGVASGTNLMLTGGVQWTYQELLTLTASKAEFLATNVGDQRVIRDAAGDQIRFTIRNYVSPTVVTGTADMNVPVGLQGTVVTDWDRAVRAVAGLDYLDGQAVSIYADGYVVASPNNPDYPTPTVVVGGQVTLDRPHAFVRVGLPITADLETLDIDMPNGPTVKEKKMNVTSVGAYVEACRGPWVGTREPVTSPTDGLTQMQLRNTSDNMAQPMAPVTDYQEIGTDGTWNTNGRIFVRQVDPLPISVLALAPLGFIPKGGRE